MPWLETHRKSGTFHIVLRYGDRKYKQSLRTKSQVEADAQLAKVKFNLHLCEMGRLEIPSSIHPLDFLLADGKVDESATDSPIAYTLDQLVGEFFASIPERSLEETNKIRGWHCFRHSFISNLACQGVDQRIIDEFVGHTTEQMRRRYRHLFPNVKKEALLRVFG